MTIQFPCPVCRCTLTCADHLRGSKGQCKSCGQIVRIGGDSTDNSIVFDTTPFVFDCPNCHQLFEGQADMDGRAGRCDRCHTVFPIKLRRQVAASKNVMTDASASHDADNTRPSDESIADGTQLTADNDRSALRAAAESSAHPVAHPVDLATITCGQCGGAMTVLSEQQGTIVGCPHCGVHLTVPMIGSPANPIKAPLDASDPTLKQQAADVVQRESVGNAAPTNEHPTTMEAAAHQDQLVNPYEVSTAATSSGRATRRRGRVRRSRAGERFSFAAAWSLFSSTCFPQVLISTAFFIAYAIVVVTPLNILGRVLSRNLLSSMNNPSSGAFESLTLSLMALGCLYLAMIIASSLGGTILLSHALAAVRREKVRLLETNGATWRMSGEVLLQVLITAPPAIGLGAILQWVQPDSTVILFVAAAVGGIYSLVMVTLMVFTPFAIVDGERPWQAIRTSAQICLQAPATIAYVLVISCGFMICLVMTLTVGILATAFPVFAITATYELARPIPLEPIEPRRTRRTAIRRSGLN
ncbi:MAG: hypothetical protein AAF670_17355 [Planctomycetota bacterium]